MNSAEGIRLYVHYPYCLSKCAYCAFPSVADFSSEKAYLEALLREICTFSTDRPVVSLFFGGGSPSLMSLEILREILARLKVFCLPDAEMTIELKPELCISGFSAKYAELGINRVSVGVQSFLSEKLSMFGRPPLPRSYVRPADVCVSFDIIIGTRFDDSLFEKEVEAIVKYGPDHLSVYPLSLEVGSLFFQSPPPDLSVNIGQQYKRYGKLLNEAGYYRYEASNFCRNKEYMCRHNSGYWHNDDFVGFGVGSHSRIGLSSWHNTFSIADYVDSAKHGLLVKKEHVTFTNLEYSEQTLLMGLRLTEGVSTELVLRRAEDSAEKIISKIELLLEANYARIENGFIRANKNLNFDKCLRLFNWHACVRYGWRTVVPDRIKEPTSDATSFP